MTKRQQDRYLLLFAGTALLLLAVFLASLHFGKVSVGLDDIWTACFSQSMTAEERQELWTVFFRLRLTRSLLAILVGAALSAAGAVMQGLYRNPLAAPDVLGVTQAANFGVGAAIFFFSAGTLGVQLTAFFFGILALLGTFGLLSRMRNTSITTLVLLGVILSALFQAGLTLLLYLSDPYSELLRINYWLMGAFNAASWQDVLIAGPVILIALTFLLVFRWRLNLLTQGDEDAMALGIHLGLWRTLYLLAVALMVSVSTACVGNISWVGLIVPHIARYAVGTNQARVIPYSALLGAVLLLFIDTIVRNLPCGEIPISVITSLIAAPFLLLLVLSQQKKGAWS